MTIAGWSNAPHSMPENVLLITGGLITSQERSILHAGRKWLAQMIGAKAAWLDCKVKLAIAEPMIASRVERARFRMRSPPWRPIVDELFADRGRYDAPSLTEVVLSTLLERAGIAHECTTFDELFGAPRRMSRLLEGTGCVFLSTTYLHDLSELEPLVRRVKRPHNRVVVGGALMGAIAHAWEGMDGVDLVAVGYGELMMDAIAGWIRGGYGNPPPPPQGHAQTTSPRPWSLRAPAGPAAGARKLAAPGLKVCTPSPPPPRGRTK